MASAQDWRDLRAEFETLKSELERHALDPIRAEYAPPGWGHPLDRHPVQRWMQSGGDEHGREKFERLARSAATLLVPHPCGDPEQWLDFLRELAVDIRSGSTISSGRDDVWSIETRTPISEPTFVMSSIDDVCAASMTACTLLATGTVGVPRGVDVIVPPSTAGDAAASGSGTPAATATEASAPQTDDVPADGDRLPPLTTKEQRQAAVKKKLKRVSRDTEEPLRHYADFWKAAKIYQDRKSFGNWVKKGSAAPSAHQTFCRVLLLRSVEFVAALRQWRKKPKRTSRKKTAAG